MVDAPKRPVVRLSDVAKRAQCSAATVSRVLNAPETVNRDARLRVEAAVQDLGYTRNAAARALRSRRSQIVGIVLPTLKHPVYADFIEGAQTALARRDHSLLIASSDFAPERELFQARLLAERGVDGLVLIGADHLPALDALLDGQDLPFVFAHASRPGSDHPFIGCDDVAGMVRIVDHLHGLGHREFGLVAGPRAAGDRVAGALARLAGLGIAPPAERVVEGDLSLVSGREAIRRLVAAGPMPTAVLCSDDVLAYGAMIECRVLAIAVPGDLSITGFGDLPSSVHMFPALTTLAVPAEDMGRRAADHLMARLAGEDTRRQVVFETRLALRDTTARPGRPWRGGELSRA